MAGEVYVVRVGDGGEYREFDSLWEVADHLADERVPPPLSRHNALGVSARGFAGDNYISLYVGPDLLNPETGLSDHELAVLNSFLLRETKERT